MGWISIKLVVNVGTSIQLIVSKFHKNRSSFDVIMTSFLFPKVISKGSYSAQSQTKKLYAKGNNYDAQECDTSDSDLLVGLFGRGV